ncbi:MAG: hypothetical protein H8E57_04040 [Candidatus Cloacimonetes bacterium]|nr:hypothetical protein [Candidatus Cloacimonadota bacterium]
MERSKKLKAAIAGVIYYLQEKEITEKTKHNKWARSGREIIMRNRTLVQLRGSRR